MISGGVSNIQVPTCICPTPFQIDVAEDSSMVQGRHQPAFITYLRHCLQYCHRGGCTIYACAPPLGDNIPVGIDPFPNQRLFPPGG